MIFITWWLLQIAAVDALSTRKATQHRKHSGKKVPQVVVMVATTGPECLSLFVVWNVVSIYFPYPIIKLRRSLPQML